MPHCPTPKKADDESYTYVFKIWDPVPVPVTGDMTYTAVYSKNSKYATDDLGYALNPDGQSYTCSSCKRTATEVVGAAYYDSLPVTAIADSTFEGNKLLTSVVLTKALVSIGEEAFADCTALASLNIPSSVKSIAEDVFYGCTALNNVTFGESLLSLGENAFLDDRALTSLQLPTSVTTLGNSAFAGCSSLTHIDLGTSLVKIPNSLFEGDSLLSHISLPSSLQDIDFSAFRDCTALASFALPSSNAYLSTDTRGIYKKSDQSLIAYADNSGIEYEVQTGTKIILNEAFVSCIHLTAVILPDSVNALYPDAFDACSALVSVSLPNSIASLPTDTFLLCKALTSLTYRGTQAEWAKLEKAYNWADGCSKLTSVICTDGTVSL